MTAPSAAPAETDTAYLADARSGIGNAGTPQVARHPVNEPAIADWCDAMGDDNPVFNDAAFAATSVHGGIVAPAVTLDIWDRGGLKQTRSADDPCVQCSGLTVPSSTNRQRSWSKLRMPR